MALGIPAGLTFKSGVDWGLADLDWTWLGSSASYRWAGMAQHQATMAGVSVLHLFHTP